MKSTRILHRQQQPLLHFRLDLENVLIKLNVHSERFSWFHAYQKVFCIELSCADTIISGFWIKPLWEKKSTNWLPKSIRIVRIQSIANRFMSGINRFPNHFFPQGNCATFNHIHQYKFAMLIELRNKFHIYLYKQSAIEIRCHCNFQFLTWNTEKRNSWVVKRSFWKLTRL